MTLFSLMFGAGIALISERAATAGRPVTGLLMRRNAWLLVLGLLHAYLIWFGDILVSYALCGFLVVLLRNRKPRTQLIIGLLFLLLPALLMWSAGLTLDQWPEAAMEEANADWAPGPALIAEELETYRGGWLGQMPHRVEAAERERTDPIAHREAQ